MSDCVCQRLGTRLQGPAHQLHTSVERRILQVREWAPRYLSSLRARPHRDPEREALIEQARARLAEVHRRGERYLPTQSVRSECHQDFPDRMDINQRRTRNGRR